LRDYRPCPRGLRCDSQHRISGKTIRTLQNRTSNVLIFCYRETSAKSCAPPCPKCAAESPRTLAKVRCVAEKSSVTTGGPETELVSLCERNIQGYNLDEPTQAPFLALVARKFWLAVENVRVNVWNWFQFDFISIGIRGWRGIEKMAAHTHQKRNEDVTRLCTTGMIGQRQCRALRYPLAFLLLLMRICTGEK
jgi:hypothetical protein